MAASPKSENCSCCCCCSVVTVVGAGVLTARSVRTARATPAPKVERPSSPGGPYREARPEEARPSSPVSRTGARVFAFFLLPLALLLGGLAATRDESVGITVGVLTYVGGLVYLVAKAVLPPWVLLLVVLVPAVAAAEAYVFIVTVFR